MMCIQKKVIYKCISHGMCVCETHKQKWINRCQATTKSISTNGGRTERVQTRQATRIFPSILIPSSHKRQVCAIVRMTMPYEMQPHQIKKDRWKKLQNSSKLGLFEN